MSNSKSQKQHSSSSLEGWLERDKAIALRARSALEKFSPEELAFMYAEADVGYEMLKVQHDFVMATNLQLLEALGAQIKEIPGSTQAQVGEVNELTSVNESLEKMRQLGHVEAAYKGHHRAKQAVEAKHNKPGGSREKRNKIRAIWASGKYSTRLICAEEEYDALGMSFDTARKALQGEPNPT